jgi:capsular exopolysaccharide synthesis family protein
MALRRRLSDRVPNAPQVSVPARSAAEYLREWTRVLYRRRLLAAAVLILVTAAAVTYTYTRQPIYEAQTQILIEPADPNIITFQDVVDDSRANGTYYQTQYELLRSRALARRTLRHLNLWRHPYFGGAGAAPASTGAAGGAAAADAVPVRNPAVLANEARAAEAASAPTPQADPTALSGAIGVFQRDLQIVPIRSTRLVSIRFRSTDPNLAADVVNAHARQYIEQNLEFRAQASEEATEWLNARLDQERRRVEDAESILQRFREDHDALSLEEGQNIVVQKLAELNTAVTRAKTRRLEAEAQYRQVAALQGDSLDSFPAVLGNELIQQLKVDLAGLQREHAQLSETLGDRHPRIIEKTSAIQATNARIQAEVRAIVSSLRAGFDSAVAEETSLVNALEAQKNEALAQNRRGIEYGVLKREADSTREVYRSLLQRAKETGVSRELRASNIRVIDAAEPPRGPVSPNTRANLMLGLLAGMVLAAGAVFGLELLDECVKVPQDVTAYLGIPFLGIVPKVRRPRSNVYLSGEVQPAVEAFRALRSLLLYPADGSAPARSIVVTSAARGEGKTVVATNLAIALAKNHRRVLLIDADMRDPGVHELFAQPRDPGLSNVLRGEVHFDVALRPTNTPGLELMPAGPVPSDPTELLGSPAFKKLLATADGTFHYVIIDSPPVMAVADAVVAAHDAAAVLFVVGADMTTRESARLAVEQLRSVGAHVIGGVLNGADLRRHPYYYAPYYRREYTSTAEPRRGSPLSIT